MLIQAELKKRGENWEDHLGGATHDNFPEITSPRAGTKPLIIRVSPSKKRAKEINLRETELHEETLSDDNKELAESSTPHKKKKKKRY